MAGKLSYLFIKPEVYIAKENINMAGMGPQKIEIFGLINDVNFQRARYCAEVYSVFLFIYT